MFHNKLSLRFNIYLLLQKTTITDNKYKQRLNINYNFLNTGLKYNTVKNSDEVMLGHK